MPNKPYKRRLTSLVPLGGRRPSNGGVGWRHLGSLRSGWYQASVRLACTVSECRSWYPVRAPIRRVLGERVNDDEAWDLRTMDERAVGTMSSLLAEIEHARFDWDDFEGREVFEQWCRELIAMGVIEGRFS